MKVSIVCSRFPYPIEKGDKLRMFHQIRELSAAMDIQLIALSHDRINSVDENILRKYCREVKVIRLNKMRQKSSLAFNVFTHLPFQVKYFYDPLIKRSVQAAILNYNPDVIYCQLIRSAEYVKAMPFPKVLDYMDAFSLNYARRISEQNPLMRIVYREEVKRLKTYEEKIAAKFDELTIISAQDREALTQLDKGKVKLVSNGVDAEYFHPSPHNSEKLKLLFVGNMGYEPNDIAAHYILDKIYPAIRKIIPEIEILIAGARPSRSLLKYQSDTVHITGWIDDIRVAYNEGGIFIAPLFSGSGLQNKILEAMAMELPVITTSIVNNSIGVHKDNFIEANDVEEFVRGIVKLSKDKGLRKELGDKGREFVLQHFTWKATTHKLKVVLEDVVTNGNNS